MSLFRLGLRQIGNTSRIGLRKVTSLRTISQSVVALQDTAPETAPEPATKIVKKPKPNWDKDTNFKINLNDPSDRSQEIPVELGLKYMESDAYKTTYGEDPVWKHYRRNYKGHFMPKKTRKTCIRNNILATGNPCPICRDEYLVLDYRNTKLLKQFMNPLNGETLSYTKTGICQRQHTNLLIALYKAKDYGTITYDPPFIEFNYSDWYDCKPKPQLIEGETDTNEHEQYGVEQQEYEQHGVKQQEHEQQEVMQDKHEQPQQNGQHRESN